MEALEQPVEGITPQGVRDIRPIAPLERVRLEEAAVEKGYGAKLPSCTASFRPGLIQGSEKEWPKEVAVDSAPPAETAVHFLGQEAVSLPQPAFTLDEVEKEDAGQLE